MNSKFRIPVAVVAIFLVILFFSGEYPISFCLYVTLMGLSIAIIGNKTNYKFGKMFPWGLLVTVFLSAVYIGLLVLAKDISWLAKILDWPVGSTHKGTMPL